MADDRLAVFRNRLHQGPDPALAADLEAAVAARLGERGGHADWGLLCEEAGLFALAFREFQLALRDDPHDRRAAERLAHHYRERGDTARAADLLERLLAAEPAREDWLRLLADVLAEDGATPRLRAALDRAVRAGLPPERAGAIGRTAADVPEEEPEAEGDLAPTDADCVRFQGLFAGREDVHARQWAKTLHPTLSPARGEGHQETLSPARGEGHQETLSPRRGEGHQETLSPRRGEGGVRGDVGYSPVQEPLTAAVVRNHLLGTYTVGVYPIRLDGTCTFFAVDLDIDKGALEQAHGRPEIGRRLRDDLRAEAARLLNALHGLGFAPLFEDSGYKGRHYWVFLEQPEAAEVLHQLGRQFLAWQGPQVPRGLHLEFFPKQGSRGGKGLGNLIKLPLGIHRRTGRRSLLLDETGRSLARPLEALRHIRRLSRTDLYAAIERLKGMALPPPNLAAVPETTPPPARPTPGPPPPSPAPTWTETDFDTDPRLRHLLNRCPVLAELKRTVDQHRRLSHEEQLVLIHTIGHVEGGPLAVNYLFGKCVDVGREKFLKDRLKGNPVSCASIRKKIGHITRRVACNCPFDFAPDRYPTPVLHLLTLPVVPATPPPPADPNLETLARRYAATAARLEEIRQEHDELRQALIQALRQLPDRTLTCPGGRYRLLTDQGVEELRWEEDLPQKDAKDAKG